MVEYDRNMEYCTNDLYFATFLLCVGMKKTRVVKEGVVFYFLFDDHLNTVRNLEKDYFSYKARVCPLKYKSSLKDLRTEMNFLRSQV